MPTPDRDIPLVRARSKTASALSSSHVPIDRDLYLIQRLDDLGLHTVWTHTTCRDANANPVESAHVGLHRQRDDRTRPGRSARWLSTRFSHSPSEASSLPDERPLCPDIVSPAGCA